MYKRRPARRRICPRCLGTVSGNQYPKHARGDRCPKRPSPIPDRCPKHGREWPCVSCEVEELQAQGLPLHVIASVLGLSVQYVADVLGLEQRRMKRTLKRYGAVAPRMPGYSILCPGCGYKML